MITQWGEAVLHVIVTVLVTLALAYLRIEIHGIHLQWISVPLAMAVWPAREWVQFKKKYGHWGLPNEWSAQKHIEAWISIPFAVVVAYGSARYFVHGG